MMFAVAAALAMLGGATAVQNITADFIIVGGGTGGVIMAHSLTSQSNLTVIVLEAGGDPTSSIPNINIPMFDFAIRGLPNSDWGFKSVPQVYAGGVNVSTVRFKGLGGCSQHNGEGFWTASKESLNKWPNGFKYKDFKDAALEFEGFAACTGGCPNHGTTGPLYTKIDDLDTIDPMLIAWKQAVLQAGYDFVPDQNSPKGEGYMQHVVTIKNGQRYGPYGVLKDARTAGLPNLQIKLNTTVTKILTGGTVGCRNDVKVIGVAATFNDGTQTADFNYLASKGVILAAGAFKTPQLLMVSGFGDSQQLNSLGIPVKVDLKGVGKNLKDHYGIPLIYIAKQYSPINNQTFMNQQIAQYAQSGTGYLALPSFNHALVTLNSNGNVHSQKADVALVTGPLSFFPDPHQTIAFSILVAPYSTGTVKITSSSIYDKPLIDYGYFSDNRDWIALNNSFKVTRTILGQSAFSDWFNFEVFPAGAPDTVVKSQVVTAEHPMGTCKMGKRTDDDAVVDTDGSVYGTAGLYIADASVIPTTDGATPDASIHATVILLTRIIADGLLCDFANVCN